MIERILNSKNFVACLLAAIKGMALYFKLPSPQKMPSSNSWRSEPLSCTKGFSIPINAALKAREFE